MKRMIAAAALAIGFLALRMGAMQQEAQEMMRFKDKNGVEFSLPRERAMLLGTISNLIEDLGESNDPIPLGLVTKDEVQSLLERENYNFILSAHNKEAAAVSYLSNEEREKKGQEAANNLAAGDYAYSKEGLHKAWGYLKAAHYLYIPELKEKYARIIAGMLYSDASMKLLQSNDKDHIKLVREMNVARTYADVIMRYMPHSEWGVLRTLDSEWGMLGTFPGGWVAVFSPDGKKIVTASGDRTAKIWNANTGILEHTLAGHTDWVFSAVFSPDGKKIVTASSDDTAKIWNANTGILERTLAGHTHWIDSAAFSPDGQKIVTASQDGTAKIWNASTGIEEHTLAGHGGNVTSAAFSPDGKKIVTASDDDTAKVWNANTGIEEHTLAGHTHWIESAAFSPDGKKILVVSYDGTAEIWNANTGIEEHTLAGHTEAISSAVFSPDGKKIVTASEDRTAKIWNADTGIEEHTFAGHTDGIESAAFSPDGEKIVTASRDRTAKIWNADTGIEEHTLAGHTRWIESAAFSPDGKKIVTASGRTGDGTAKIWISLSADSMEQALFLRYLAFIKKQGGQPGWMSGWGRSVMDSYDAENKALIELIYPKSGASSSSSSSGRKRIKLDTDANNNNNN